MNKNELWQKILHIAITILTAIATTFGVTSCIGLMNSKKGVGQLVGWSVYFSHHLHHSSPPKKNYSRTCVIMQNDYQKSNVIQSEAKNHEYIK